MKIEVKERKCSFCGKDIPEVEPLIRVGKSVNSTTICRSCANRCVELFAKQNDGKKSGKKTSLLKPQEIKTFLDAYVIGQEEVKKTLAVAVYNHYKRIKSSLKSVEIQKSNILLVGPTGSGKTYMVRSLAKMLDVPFVVADATSITQAGYIGADAEDMLVQLIAAANGDIKKAETGIIYIDEIDKLSRNRRQAGHADPSSDGAQQALLKIIEGETVQLSDRKTGGETQTMNTSNILFICGGAFDGIEDIIQARLHKNDRGQIGFNSVTKKDEEQDKEKLLQDVQMEDLMKYGMMPEFIGRLPVVAVLNKLSRADLKRILVEPKNALTKQYQGLLRMDGVKLSFTDEAITAIADAAMQRKTGARGLRSILEHSMKPIMYTLPSHPEIAECIITKDVITNATLPVLKKRTAGTAKSVVKNKFKIERGTQGNC